MATSKRPIQASSKKGEKERSDGYVRWSDLEEAFRKLQQFESPTQPAIKTAKGRKRNPAAEVTLEASGPTRERILVATAQVLSEKGYAGTRLTDVAAVAGLQAPAIYYYFASREELIAEVMVVGQARLREYVEKELATLPSEATPIERICTAIAAHLRMELQLSDFATAAIRNAGQLPEEVRNIMHDEGRAYQALWRNLLAEAQAKGQLRQDLDLRAARMLIMGALNWTVEWWKVEKGPLDIVVQAAQTLVCHGIQHN